MHTLFTRLFLNEPPPRSVAYRYGFLILLLCLTVLGGFVGARAPRSARGSYIWFLLPPTLLANHLAYQFDWSVPVRIRLRVLSIIMIWVVLGYEISVYIAP